MTFLSAILEVESNGTGLMNGRPVIRVEAHLAWMENHDVEKFLHVGGPKAWEGHVAFLDGAWRHYHGDQDREWRVYEMVDALNHEAAVTSTSWGAGQILGWHWQRCGFETMTAFVDTQYSQAGQEATLTAFVESDPVLVEAMDRLDFLAFARSYNGNGKVEEYARRLEEAYRRLA